MGIGNMLKIDIPPKEITEARGTLLNHGMVVDKLDDVMNQKGMIIAKRYRFHNKVHDACAVLVHINGCVYLHYIHTKDTKFICQIVDEVVKESWTST